MESDKRNSHTVHEVETGTLLQKRVALAALFFLCKGAGSGKGIFSQGKRIDCVISNHG